MSCEMRTHLCILRWLIIILTVTFSVIMLCVVFNDVYFHYCGRINTELAAKFGDFFGGFLGTLFGFLSVIILAYSILKQTCETRRNNIRNTFFKMIDYHYKNLEQIELANPGNYEVTEKGRRGFVAYKIQIKRLLQAICKINRKRNLGLNAHDVASIAYMVFYYGVDESWMSFLENKINCYDCREVLINDLITLSKNNPDLKLCRTNQTILSAYFRNMYNAIKLVDSDGNFTKEEKYDLIKIYRAQLSNPELYILFFNVISSFGKKWREKDFVRKYSLIKNIPYDYLDGYEAKRYFNIVYEYEEVNCEKDNDIFPDVPPLEIKSKTCLSSQISDKKKAWFVFGGFGRR